MLQTDQEAITFAGGGDTIGNSAYPLTVAKGGNNCTGAVVANNQVWDGGSNTVTWDHRCVDALPNQLVPLVQ